MKDLAADLSKAYELEAEFLDIQGMMQNMEEEKPTESIEDQKFRIRNMMLAIQYLEKDIEEMETMKKMVVSNWDSKIKDKKDNIDSIRNYVAGWIQDKNQGETLSTDVATVSVRKPKIQIKIDQTTEENLIERLSDAGALEPYLKEPVFDKSLYIKTYKETVSNQAKALVEEEVEALIEQGERVTKAKQKRMIEKKENELYHSYFETGASPIQPVYSKPTVTIRKNIEI